MTDKEIAAADAERILSDPVVQRALARMKDAAVEALLRANSDEERRRLADKANIVRAFETELRSAIEMVRLESRPRGGLA